MRAHNALKGNDCHSDREHMQEVIREGGALGAGKKPLLPPAHYTPRQNRRTRSTYVVVMFPWACPRSEAVDVVVRAQVLWGSRPCALGAKPKTRSRQPVRRSLRLTAPSVYGATCARFQRRHTSGAARRWTQPPRSRAAARSQRLPRERSGACTRTSKDVERARAVPTQTPRTGARSRDELIAHVTDYYDATGCTTISRFQSRSALPGASRRQRGRLFRCRVGLCDDPR